MLRISCALLFLTLPANAQVPPDFLGVWIMAAVQDTQCKQSDWEENRSDAMMITRSRSVQGWEHFCNIKRVRKISAQSIEVDVDCGGEGMTWKAKEHWHTQLVHGKKQLVIFELSRGDWRDSGKRVKGPPDPQNRVSIHLACN